MNWEVGQEVAVFRCYSETPICIRKIERLTKTQVIIAIDWRFRVNDGSEIGATRYNTAYIVPATDEHRDRLRRKGIISRLKITTWSDLDTSTLEAVLALVEQAQNPQNPASLSADGEETAGAVSDVGAL